MGLIENERTKLTANFMNAVASGSILVAIVGRSSEWLWELCRRKRLGISWD